MMAGSRAFASWRERECLCRVWESRSASRRRACRVIVRPVIPSIKAGEDGLCGDRLEGGRMWSNVVVPGGGS